MTPYIQIGGRRIGEGEPVYIVCELSANHHQQYEQAVELIRIAKEAGADAVKLQTYTPDTMTIRSDKRQFCIGGGTLWDGQTLYDLYGQAYTPWDWHPRLKKLAEEIEIDLFSTPFDNSAVEYLRKMDVPVYKVASFEIVDLALIRKVAATGRPMIISTGMATFQEIEEAVRTAQDAGASQIALLKCTSAYPAPYDEMNLSVIRHLSESFDVPVGVSDHTLGIAVPAAAIAMGACMIEKHVTLSRSVPGPDSAFSLEPRELKEMVQAVRIVERALGKVKYEASKSEEASRIFRRSLFVVNDMKAGEIFTEDTVRSIRPGHGLPPKHLKDVLGRKAACDIERGTPVGWDLLLKEDLDERNH